MGGSHGKSKDSNSQLPLPPPTSLHEIRAKLRPLSANYQDENVHHTLDTTLKGFLKACNMKGLEYRLRLAGVYTLEDLIEKDEATLTRHGFTSLMARKLFRSLEDYLSGPEITPFMVVRPNHKLSTKPSVIMRSNRNFGKINKKRPSLKSINSPSSSPRASRRPQLQRPKSIPLGTPETVSLPEVKVAQATPTGTPTAAPKQQPTSRPSPEQNNEVDTPSSDESENLPVASTSSPLPATIDVDTIRRLVSDTPIKLERCVSTPCSLNCYHGNDDEIDDASPWRPLRQGTSCPDVAFHDDTQVVKDILEEAVDVLRGEGKLNEVSCALYSLLDGYKSDHPKGIDSLEVVALVGKALSSLSAEVDVAEVGCRVLKYVTQYLLENGTSDLEERSLLATAITVVGVIKYHARNKRIQLNGCLTLSNLVRLDSSLTGELLGASILPHLSSSLMLYEDSEIITTAVLSLLSVLAASTPDARQTIVSDFQPTLTQAGDIINKYSSSHEILEYSLSFIALALIDVASQLNPSVVKPLTMSVLRVLEDNIEDAMLVVWGCKIIAQVSSHEMAQEKTIAKAMVDKLLKCLSQHSESPSVQTWASYALYQLVSFNSVVLPMIQGRGCIEQSQAAMPHLDKEARSYLEQLTKLATI